MSPYYNASFFDCLSLFITRFFSLSFFHELYPDEVQLLALFMIATCTSFLGVFLVLKRLTMMANALSHTTLLGLVLGLIFLKGYHGSLEEESALLLLFALLSSFLSCFLIEWLSKIRGISKDAGNAVIFSLFFSLAVLLLSLFFKNSFLSVEFLMGNADALFQEDLFPIFWMSLFALLTGVVLFRGFALSIFDETFASFQGFNPTFFIYLLMALVSSVIVISFHAVGFIMVLSFFVLPPLIARYWTKRLPYQLFASVLISQGTVIISVALSRHILSVYAISVSTSALAAVLLAVLFLFSHLFMNYKIHRRASRKGLVHEIP